LQKKSKCKESTSTQARDKPLSFPSRKIFGAKCNLGKLRGSVQTLLFLINVTHTRGTGMSKTLTATPPRLEEEIAALGGWFHNLHLPDGTQTAPNHSLGDFPSYKWKRLSTHLPADLSGWKVLDIGCNAGFYTFELAKRGATVTGIDIDRHYLTQARWAARQYKLEDRVSFRQMQVYDLAHEEETFDLVLFMGVFYHLRYPTLALDIVAQRVKRLLVFQSLTMPGKEVAEHTGEIDFNNRERLLDPGWPKMAFLEHGFAGDPTNYWAPNHACVEAMLRASGMQVTKAIGHELYLCVPDPEHPSAVTTWNRAELRSATGKKWHGEDQ
jgi:tRNA (mo5U34)-methyltransferase